MLCYTTDISIPGSQRVKLVLSLLYLEMGKAGSLSKGMHVSTVSNFDTSKHEQIFVKIIKLSKIFKGTETLLTPFNCGSVALNVQKH